MCGYHYESAIQSITKESKYFMLDFKPISEPYSSLLRKYYGQCTYRLCEYSWE